MTPLRSGLTRELLEADLLVAYLGLTEHEVDHVAFDHVRFHLGQTRLIRIIPAHDLFRVFIAFCEFVHLGADLFRLRFQAIRLDQLGQHQTQTSHAAQPDP